MADDGSGDEFGEMMQHPESIPDAEPKQRGCLVPTTATMDEETHRGPHRRTRPSL